MATAFPVSIPLEVRRTLRREVNFGCPAPDCGSPYLTYHHFDPPRRVRHHHELPRMVALCWPHHQVAEAGAFTPDQLRGMKERPFLSEPPIQGRFEGWNRRRLVIRLGENWFFRPPCLLRVGGQILVGMSQVDDYEGLDLDARSIDGQPLLQMKANDWQLETIPDDLVVGNRFNNLKVDLSSRQIHFDIRFRSYSREEFRAFLDREEPGQQDGLMGCVLEWPVALCTLTGAFVWPSPVAVGENGIVGGKRRWQYEGNVLFDQGIDLP